MSGVRSVYRVEVEKLLAQRRTWLVAAACLLAAPALLAVLPLSSGLPTDTLFGRQLRDTGFATPLLLLTFCGLWVLPILSALVAGDICSSEDAYGTWQLLLTRSVTRSQVFAGKALAAATWALLTGALLAGSSLLAGVLVVGTQPLLDLSGAALPAGRATLLVLAGWATALPPVLACTALALLLSVAARNCVVGTVGAVVLVLLMQLGSQFGPPGPLRNALLPTAFGAWHGLLLQTPTYRPLLIGVGVSSVWTLGCLLAARSLLLRRDVAVA